jgi:tetratricopeptide (TPR) repeat protein
MGGHDQAVENLDLVSRQAGAASDAESDRALLALLDGDPEAALEILDRVLEEEPQHPQALWNRALALRELGLLLAAAAAFEQVAALNEPGWHQEAREQARTLRALAQEREQGWRRIYDKREELLRTGAGLSPADVASQPGLVRQLFYDAVRVTASPERLEALRPIARALDAHYGGGVLTAYLDRVSRSDLGKRAPLARAYLELFESNPHEPGAARAWLEEGLAGDPGASDILLGVADHTGETWGWIPAEVVPVYRRLAEESNDPWFMLLAAEREADLSTRQRDYDSAIRVLTEAISRCDAAGIEIRCIYLQRLLGHAYTATSRVSDGRRHLMMAWVEARRTSNWQAEQLLLKPLADFAYRRDDSGTGSIAAARAYLDELALREPSCANRLYRHRLVATMLVVQNRLEAARQEFARAADLLAGDTTCKAPPFSIQVALAHAYVLDPARDAPAIAALQAQLEAFRGAGSRTPGELAFLAHIEGRLLIQRDRAAGHALLREAIAQADELPAGDVPAQKARSHSYMLLVRDASAHGEHERALSLIAEEQGVEVPDRCVVGIASEQEIVVVARGADGAILAGRQPFGAGVAAERVVPDQIRRALSGCETVDVLARAPYFGSPRLLPADLAWRFRSRRAGGAQPGLPRRRVIVADVEPPPSLRLPRLAMHLSQQDAAMLRGAAATPRAVLAAIAEATELEVHAHGILDTKLADAAFLALSPDADGRYELTADDIRQQRLAGAPSVLLGACHAAYTTRFFHNPSSLASAFVEAGARVVIASPAPSPDADTNALFADLRQRLASGQLPAVAMRDMRTHAAGAAERGWIDDIVVFE